MDDKKEGASTDFPSVWKQPSIQRTPPLSSRSLPDSFAPPAFAGTNVDADAWLAHFLRYTEYKQFTDVDIVAIFPLFLKEAALDWFDNLSQDIKSDWQELLNNFRTYFGKSELDYVFAEETVFSRVQRPKEKVRDYIAQMQKLARRIPNLQDGILQWVILRGLRPQIKAGVIQMKGEINTVADILTHAKVAEAASQGSDEDTVDSTQMQHLMEQVRAGRDEVQQLSARLARMSISSVQTRSPTPERRSPRVTFQNTNSGSRYSPYNNSPSYRGNGDFRGQRRSASSGRRFGQEQSSTTYSLCGRCGRNHGINRCPAFNAVCYGCGRRGHLRARCRSARRGALGASE